MINLHITPKILSSELSVFLHTNLLKQRLNGVLMVFKRCFIIL